MRTETPFTEFVLLMDDFRRWVASLPEESWEGMDPLLWAQAFHDWIDAGRPKPGEPLT